MRLFNRFYIILFAIAPLVAHAQFAHTSGESIIDRDGHPLAMRCANFGNWMVPEGYMWQIAGHIQSPREIETFVNMLIGPERSRAFWQTWRDTYITQADVHLLHQAGFNCVRVPFHYKFFQTDDAEGFRLVDRLAQWAHAENILLILDMHAAPGGQTGSNIDDSDGFPWLFNDASAQEQYLATWQRIAHHYRNDPTILGYDLLNEPLPNYPSVSPMNSLLEPLYKKVATAIRKVDSHHILILEAAHWDTDFTVFGAPFDPNTIYEFHHYGGPIPDQAVIQRYLDFRAKYHVPLWLGEAGENKDEWIAGFRTLVEQNNIGWAFWPYKKMGSHSAIETVTRPADWDAIDAYTKLPAGVAQHQTNLAQRPDQAVIDRVLAELLQNIQFAHCTTNMGYLHALLPSTPVDEHIGR
jgi:endoglucanase